MGAVESLLVSTPNSSDGREKESTLSREKAEQPEALSKALRRQSAPVSQNQESFKVRKHWRASSALEGNKQRKDKILKSPSQRERRASEKKGNAEPPKKATNNNNNNEKIFFPLPSPLVLRKKREASLNGNSGMEDFFEGMPIEMLFYILQFLEIYELARLSFVCKYFKTVLEQPESDTTLWRHLHDRTFGGGGRKTLYYRVDLRKGSGRPWEDDSNAQYWRRVCIDETRQLLWRAKNRGEKLRWAAEKGHWRILKDTLKELGPSPDLSEVNRLMVICAGEGHTKSVELLASILISAGVGIDGTGLTPKNGYCALLKAALWGNPEVVKLLLTKGANVNVKDKWNDTACIKAARAGHKDVVKILICHKQCDLSLKNLDGDDALLAAAKAGHMDVVQVLLAAGATVGRVHREYLHFLSQLTGLC